MFDWDLSTTLKKQSSCIDNLAPSLTYSTRNPFNLNALFHRKDYSGLPVSPRVVNKWKKMNHYINVINDWLLLHRIYFHIPHFNPLSIHKISLHCHKINLAKHIQHPLFQNKRIRLLNHYLMQHLCCNYRPLISTCHFYYYIKANLR